MGTKEYLPLFKAVLKWVEENGKNEAIADLLLSVEVSTPSLLNDFLTEIGLTAHPLEEEGVTCYSVQYLKQAVQDLELNGSTNLLEQSRQ